jgi:hypothetical protein
MPEMWPSRSIFVKAIVLLTIAYWAVDAQGSLAHASEETAVALQGVSLMPRALRPEFPSLYASLAWACSGFLGACPEFKPRYATESRSIVALSTPHLKSVKLQV